MGVVRFLQVIEATSAESGFNRLAEEAEREYGDHPYNGTISTCNMGPVRKIADKYTEAVEQEAIKIAENDGYGFYERADVLDLGFVCYRVETIKKVTVKPEKPAKFEMKYVLLQTTDSCGNQILDYFNSKDQADDAMIEAALKDPYADLMVVKRPININNGEEAVTTLSVTSKNFNTPPKKIAHNEKLFEVHKYMYYGWAAR